MMSPQSVPFSGLDAPGSISLSPYRGAPSSEHPRALLWTHSPTSLLHWGPQAWMQCSIWDLSRGQTGAQSPPWLLPPLLVLPAGLLALWAVNARCWLVSMSSTRTP